MKPRLLTFDDLYDFYSKYTKSKHFNCEKQGCEPIVVQTPAKMKFEKSEIYEGLTAVRLQACHTERNLNSSSISKEVMENKMLPTFKNRPILGYIHEVDGQLEFYGHNMHMEDDEIVYDEVAVGIIPESNEASLEYDEENDRYNVFVSGYIFDEYTKATDIIEREQELAVSVELSIKQMSYSPKDSCLIIEDGYFSGVTILGKNPDGSEVKPGMANSNIKLKDFSRSNNSMFANNSDEINSKLIETLDALNATLSKFNINDSKESEETYRKEEVKVENPEILVNEEVTETEEVVEEVVENFEETVEETVEVTEVESTEEVTETEEVEDPVEDETPEVVEEESEEIVDEEEVEEETVEENVEDLEEVFELVEKSFEIDGRKFSVSFELSHDDIRYGLYNLIVSYEEMDNEWYYIRSVYDNKFVFQGCFSGKIYGQAYTKDGDMVALDGERYELFEELLTASEKAELESMRSNYAELEQFKLDTENAQLHAQREEIISDKKYSVLAEKDENNEFKNEAYAKLVSEMDNYSLTDLEKELKSVFADYITNGGQFSYADESETNTVASKKLFAKPTSKKTSRYGNLFNK